METPPGDFGDSDLVERAQRGEREAFELLVERYKHKAYRIAFHFTREREEAEDISQEAFLRAYTHLNSFDGRSSFYTWFYRIVVNLCLDHKRKKRFSRPPLDQDERNAAPGVAPRGLPDSAPSPEQYVAAGELSRRAGAALDKLPPKQRTVFILRNHQGLSIREISEIVQSSEGTVKVHLHRAVAALRKILLETA
jgi:RNA polymerase sigma-70 factor (ECF subfamily)